LRTGPKDATPVRCGEGRWVPTSSPTGSMPFVVTRTAPPSSGGGTRWRSAGGGRRFLRIPAARKDNLAGRPTHHVAWTSGLGPGLKSRRVPNLRRKIKLLKVAHRTPRPVEASDGGTTTRNRTPSACPGNPSSTRYLILAAFVQHRQVIQAGRKKSARSRSRFDFSTSRINGTCPPRINGQTGSKIGSPPGVDSSIGSFLASEPSASESTSSLGTVRGVDPGGVS